MTISGINSSPGSGFCEQGMTRLRGIAAFLLLTTLLVAGQAGAALHALQHHAGTQQGEVCLTCVTITQPGAASVDSPIAIDLEPPHASHDSIPAPAYQSRHVLVARQRGPPTPL